MDRKKRADISPRVVIITGSTTGIGHSIAQVFAEQGDQVVIMSRHLDEAKTVAASILSQGFRCLGISCDVRNEGQVSNSFKLIYRKFGRIDVLVNNAGFNSRKKIQTITYADWENEISTNLTGAFLCSLQAAEYMKRNHQGWIINISSSKGKEPTSSAGYGASKAGVIGLTRCLAQQLAPENIFVNCVAPGVIDTGMTNMLSAEERNKYLKRIPLGRFGAPEEIASVVSFLASSASKYIIGATINVNGGYLMD